MAADKTSGIGLPKTLADMFISRSILISCSKDAQLFPARNTVLPQLNVRPERGIKTARGN